jgi:uncharacterized protein
MQPIVDGAGPFHAGELAVQSATGEGRIGAANGRVVEGHISPRAVGFVARQQLAVVATIDGRGRPWASPLAGQVESFRVLDGTRLAIERAAGRADDIMWENLRHDPRIALIFVELASRKRYRINGRVADPAADVLVVDVAEALGNCPKYITRRHLQVDLTAPDGSGAGTVGSSAELGDAERAIVAAADMCFVASANPAGNLDASHRGGRPGFVEWRDGRLWIPDYRGNSLFNTLGNLALHPFAGLLFFNFGAGETLQITGTTDVDLAVDETDGNTGGTGRAWTLTPTAWRRAPLSHRLGAEVLDRSPFNP